MQCPPRPEEDDDRPHGAGILGGVSVGKQT